MLCDNYDVLVSDELFFELITTRPGSQQRCFSKLPDKENPVSFIPNVGSLMRFEFENQISCAPLTRHKLRFSFRFNEKLRDGSYVFDKKNFHDCEEWKWKVAKDTREFIYRWEKVHHFFPELTASKPKDRPRAINAARQKIANDEDFVRRIYASFLQEGTPANSPKPGLISPDWVFFRWVQCQVLCSLRLFGRYQGKAPSPQGPIFLENIEHSMLDCYHLIHGSLVGAMATKDEGNTRGFAFAVTRLHANSRDEAMITLQYTSQTNMDPIHTHQALPKRKRSTCP